MKITRKQILLLSALAFSLTAIRPAAVLADGAVPGASQDASPDTLITENLYVQGEACVGADCVDDEILDGDTLRLKANVLRIQFNDTSIGVFPSNNWQIRANSTGVGSGTAFFGFVDQGSTGVGDTGTIVLRLDAGAPADSIRVDPLGQVGMGTSSPAGKFHVSGTGTQLSIFQSTNNGAVQFRLKSNSTNRRFVALNTADQVQSQFIFNDNGAFEFTGPTVADQRLSILSSGRVGIGTNAPDQLLSVNGNASKPGGGAWLAFSDERLKNIKGAFSSGLQAVMQLEPIRYEYKQDNALGLKSDGEHVGFGAEALEKVIPEAVTRNTDGYLMVNNDPILWTMLNAIKEQNKELKEQNDAIKGQTDEIAELRGQLKRLQAQVVLQAEARKPAPKKILVRSRVDERGTD